MVVSYCYIHHETGGMIVVFTETLILVSHKTQKNFFKFPAPRKALNETFHLLHLARSYLELL